MTMKPVKPAPAKPDSGRSAAALGLAGQIDQHAQARRAAAPGSPEWHHHSEQIHTKMAHLGTIDPQAHASVRAIVALQDRQAQSDRIAKSLAPEERRARKADPNRSEAIARDRATLREAKSLLMTRTSAARAPKSN